MTKKRKAGMWICAAVVICAAVGTAGYRFSAVTVHTETAGSGEVREMVEGTGTIKSGRTKAYYAQVSAAVQEFTGVEGASVQEGEKLVTYDISDLANAAGQAALAVEANEGAYKNAVQSDSRSSVIVKNSETSLDVLEQQIQDEKNFIAGLQETLAQAEEKAAEISSVQSALSMAADDQTRAALNEKLAGLQSGYDSLDVPGTSAQMSSHQTQLSLYMASWTQYQSEHSAADANRLNSGGKDQLQAASGAAKLQLQLAEEDLQKGTDGVIAEFNGILTDIAVEEGAMVMKGTRLFTLQDPSDCKVQLDVSKYVVGKLAAGQKATVYLADREYGGSVERISRTAEKDADKPQICVDIHMDQPDDKVYIGLEADVSILIDEDKDTLRIPAEALYTDDGSYCYVVSEGRIKRRNLVTGLTGEEYVQILEGLEAGEQVITDPVKASQEGDRAYGQNAD